MRQCGENKLTDAGCRRTLWSGLLLRLTLVLKVTTESGRHLNHTQIRTLSACRMTLLDSCSVRHFGELAKFFFPTHPHQFSLHALSTCRSAFIASSERTGERPLLSSERTGERPLPLRNSAVQHFGFACTCICLPFILLYFTFESVVSERHAHRLQRLKQIDQQVRSHPLEAVR